MRDHIKFRAFELAETIRSMRKTNSLQPTA